MVVCRSAMFRWLLVMLLTPILCLFYVTTMPVSSAGSWVPLLMALCYV